MKNLACLLVLVVLIASCNNSKNKESGQQAEVQEVVADSLFDEVMDGHDVGMAKMSKIEKARAEALRLQDSLNALPERAREGAGPFKARLDSLTKELEYADFAMNKWMEEFNIDSAKNIKDVKARIQYLENERTKVGKVKEAILSSLQKADSILK